MEIATSLAAEMDEQRQTWRLLPRHERLNWFDELVYGEFRPEPDLASMQTAALRSLVRHAVREVPYYREVFARLALPVDAVRSAAALAPLPVLTKTELHEHRDMLRARHLPPGETPAGWFRSTGTTTGRPTEVLWTRRCTVMFSLLKQREARWFRFDPLRIFGELRLNSLLPGQPGGAAGPQPDTLERARWPNIGAFFHTAGAVAGSSERPVDEIQAWIEKYQVAYLMCNPGVLEQLAFHCGERAPPSALAGMLSISGHLTAAMRARLESTYGVPVHQNYGLNEVGIVAARCLAGRYHVHAEHCVVEILDEAGQPVAPGQPGRVVVTTLQNYAMPLFRYDTDDVAVAAAGPCPCGRTLPSFARIEGRYRRYAYLPPGTRQLVNVLSDALMRAPPVLACKLRRYQAHQRRDGSFELRLQHEGSLPDALTRYVQAAWQTHPDGAAHLLTVRQVAAVARTPGGKHLEFTSEFNPADPEMPAAGGHS